MNPWISAAMGALAGYAGLALAVLWLFNLCLPVSAHQIKWQCEATYWLVALAYFAATFVATFFAGRRQIAVGLSAFAVLSQGTRSCRTWPSCRSASAGISACTPCSSR